MIWFSIYHKTYPNGLFKWIYGLDNIVNLRACQKRMTWQRQTTICMIFCYFQSRRITRQCETWLLMMYWDRIMNQGPHSFFLQILSKFRTSITLQHIEMIYMPLHFCRQQWCFYQYIIKIWFFFRTPDTSENRREGFKKLFIGIGLTLLLIAVFFMIMLAPGFLSYFFIR